MGPTHSPQPLLSEPWAGRDLYLGLSGGGFRATAHHLGVLLAYLRNDIHHRLLIVNGVSGGAIASGHLGSWRVGWEDAGRVVGLDALRAFASPLIDLMKTDLRTRVICGAPLQQAKRWVDASRESTMEAQLNRRLFRGLPLHKVMYPPLFVFTSSDLHSGQPFYLTPAGLGIRPHRIMERCNWTGSPSAARTSLARAVSASAAFPLLFTPIAAEIDGWEADDYVTAISSLFGRRWSRSGPLVLSLTDGGVADNRAQTFLASWLTGSAAIGGVRHDTPIRHAFCYDAGLEPSLRLKRVRFRVHANLVAANLLNKRSDDLNSWVLHTLSGPAQMELGVYRAAEELDVELGLDGSILRQLMRIRTDLNALSDTEIYVLAYAGYRLASWSLSHHQKLIPEALVKATRDEFDAIIEGKLDPLPQECWAGHLAHSNSRLALKRASYRAIRRK